MEGGKINAEARRNAEGMTGGRGGNGGAKTERDYCPLPTAH